MPLPGEERFVAVITQHLGEGDFRCAQVPIVLSGQMAVVSPTTAPRLARGVADPSRDAVLWRVFAGENAGARGTANLAGRVAACELHAAGGDAIDVRTFVIGGALIAEIAPAKVVGENEDDIGSPLGFVGGMNLRLGKRQAEEQHSGEGFSCHGGSRVERKPNGSAGPVQ